MTIFEIEDELYFCREILYPIQPKDVVVGLWGRWDLPFKPSLNLWVL